MVGSSLVPAALSEKSPSKKRRQMFRLAMKLLLLVACGLCFGNLVRAQSAPPLASAESFAVLGAATVTNAGPTIITGDVGVSPGTAVTGFPPGIVTGGTIHGGDPIAAAAQADAHIAYNDLLAEPCGTNLSGLTLGTSPGAVTLVPGVYCFNTAAQLTGTLTLNGNGVYIFQIGSTLTTATNSAVVLANGATSGNVFWQIGSSATLGTDSEVVGSVLALISSTVDSGTSVAGRVFALTGAVTLDTNAIATPAIPNVQFNLQGLNETVPNALPVSSPGYGSSDAPCSYSQSSNSSALCYNPLAVTFDLSIPSAIGSAPTNIPQATLGMVHDNPSTNILFDTNSADVVSSGGYVTTTASCNGTGSITNLTMIVTMDDGSTFTFIATSGKCDFSQPITGTFTSDSVASPGDSGNFVLTPYSVIDGTYQGVFDSSPSGTPFSAGGMGTATANISTNSDYTVNATATLPAASLCPAQTSPISLTTADPLAQALSFGTGIPGVAIGDVLVLPMGDGQGTVTWMFASDIDNTNDQTLSWPSQLYFSTYTVAGICGTQHAWDKVFTLLQRHSRFRVPPHRIIPRWHREAPFRWRQEILAADERKKFELRQIEGIDIIVRGPW
jgi:Ice-binding-like